MPNLGHSGKSGNRTAPKNSQVGKNNSHTRGEINKMHAPDHARDDLSEAFAGDENHAKHGGATHSTNVKSRVTEHSKDKTPKR